MASTRATDVRRGARLKTLSDQGFGGRGQIVAVFHAPWVDFRALREFGRPFAGTFLSVSEQRASNDRREAE